MLFSCQQQEVSPASLLTTAATDKNELIKANILLLQSRWGLCSLESTVCPHPLHQGGTLPARGREAHGVDERHPSSPWQARPSWGVSVPVTCSSPGTLACGGSGKLVIRSLAEGVPTAVLDSPDGARGDAAGLEVEGGSVHGCKAWRTSWQKQQEGSWAAGAPGSRGVWGGAPDPARPRPL